MQIAFIIPVTREKELRLCLQRLLQQDFPHDEYEIILIKNENFKPLIPESDIKITGESGWFYALENHHQCAAGLHTNGRGLVIQFRPTVDWAAIHRRSRYRYG